MNADFLDITSRISEPPTWWDSYGTPRWGEFHPNMCPNIYADEVVLMEIECASCRKRFNVEMHHDMSAEIFRPITHQRLSKRPQSLHYGDPPRHNCSGGGETMNCDDRKIIEFWRKNQNYDWERVPALEVRLDE